MPRAVWSGAISFGLVHIPVKATVATRDERVRFVQLHGEDGERIRYQRHCPEHGEVEYEEIVRGHPMGAGEYVVITDEEMAGLAPEKTETIDIEDFVALAGVDPIYYDKTYQLRPDGSAKAYRLLVEALDAAERIAIGRFVMRAKEHLVAIRVLDDSLVMETLHHADEVLRPEPVEGKAPTKKEKEMAVRLIESMATAFDPEAYPDTFRERLEAFLASKAEGETVQVKESPRGTVIEDLESALQKSLEEVKA